MTRDDLRIHCTALGFLAVILNGTAQDKQAVRARGIAKLIESFCWVTAPQALNPDLPSYDKGAAAIDALINIYKAGLIKGSARLPSGRTELVAMLDRLLHRQVSFQYKEFYAQGSEEMIANNILRLVENEFREQGENHE